MRTTHTEAQAVLIYQNLIVAGPDAQAIENLDSATLARYDVRRGDTVKFQQVEITLEIVQQPRYTSGYDGQLVDTVKSRSEKVLTVREATLRARKRQLTWIAN